MAAAMADAKRNGITHVIFGDLFLADIRAYREQKLAGTGIAPVFPLWGRSSFAGRSFDQALLADLPAGIDPCGENGEFHTCVVAGPMFSHRIEVTSGEVVERDGFAYCDLLPT
jgi:diphthamide synthase (EF-2-diphthine--ammonia ligase)